ncbi:hypothetical protein FA15DRAFT_669931 [Coprinopsis marcescibilis]|uniref:C2H2-type domain-containing protein n=1 Tax=Coprinopsis marcescibilis TaxID=230819 RepID=A0A5C3KV37_COPMA|nr:hypothetical protein FA15DRAFT_669931 [Coprinopsis marcescibilis]
MPKNLAPLSLQPPFPQPSSRSAIKREPVPDSISVAVRRPRRRKTSSIPSMNELFPSDDHQDDEEDDDVYRPSSSPVGSRPNSPGFDDEGGEDYGHDVLGFEKKPRRGKGKAKGSAALALAVVTQLSHLQQTFVEQQATEYYEGDNGEFAFERGSFGSRAGRKRKNNPIPLPVPVPHLIKKSRGRKVPFVPETTPDDEGSIADSIEEIEDNSEDFTMSSGSGSGSRRKSVTPYSLGEGGKRAYRCEVAGCGKCFVRGEHLKRHIRSIHTYDKRMFSH